MERQQDYVLRTVEERGIRFIQLWFTDVLGIPKCFNITPAELENALEEGMTFDGSAIDGFSRVQEATSWPIPTRRRSSSCPTRPTRRRWPGWSATSPTWTGPRSRATPVTCCAGRWRRPGACGFSFFVRSGARVLLLRVARPVRRRGRGPAHAARPGSYFELTTADLASELRRTTVLTLEDMGIPVEYSQHEDAPSQHEIDLRYTDALTMADTVMTVRRSSRRSPRQRGILATFMPKPLFGAQGSGMHTHCRCSTATPTPSTTRPTSYHLSETWPALHRRAAGPRRRDHRRHQPVGQLLQAADHRLRGAGLRVLGPQQPLRPRPGPADQERARRSRPGSSTGHPTRRPTPISPSPSSWPRAWPAIERGLQAPPGGGGQPVRANLRAAHGRKDRVPAGVAG